MRPFFLLSAVLLGLAGVSCWAATPAPVRASLVKDLDTRSGPRSSLPSLFTTQAGRVYFAAAAPATGQELYSTDAQGGLRFLGDTAPGARGSLPEPLVVVGGRLIATADDGLTGRQLWSLPVDGGQPLRLTSMNIGWHTPPGSADVMAAFGGRAILRIADQQVGLWSTDGTPGGTYYRSTASGFPLESASHGCALQDAAVLAGTASSQSLLVRSTGVPGGDSVIATLPTGTWTHASASVGGACYFLLGSYSSPASWWLWRTDGTPHGSVQLASATGYTARYLASIGNDVYWLDGRDNTNPEDARTRLWRLAAGAAQAQLVAEMPGPYSSHGPLWSHAGQVLFNAHARVDDRFEAALFGSDGTSAGTRRLYPPPGQSGTSNEVFPVAGGIVLHSYDLDVRIDLPSGVVSRIDSGGFNYSYSALLDGVRIGLGEPYGGDREVWITAGTQGSTRQLNDVWADTASGVQETGSWAAIGDRLFFTHGAFVDYGFASRVLWRTDGSEAGTTMLAKDQYQDHRGVGKVVRYGDSGVLFTNDTWYTNLYFADAALSSATLAVADIHGEFLQSTDNGVGAVYPCSDIAALCGIHPASGGSVLAAGNFDGAQAIGTLGRVAVFATAAGSSEIWRSDGTPSGTYRLLADRYLRGTAWEPHQNLALGGKLFFVSCTASYACDLTVTDGTLAGTTFLLPMPSSGISWAARVGGRLVMGIGEYWTGQLWSTDGTVVGTQLLRSGGGSQFASTGNLVHMSFECSGCKQTRLVTDGTPAGTRLLDLPSGLHSAGRFAAALSPDAVVFSCENTTRGNELCLSNATGDEIVALPEIFPGNHYSSPILIGRTASAVYFSADDGEHGRELWQLRLLTDAVFADGFQ